MAALKNGRKFVNKIVTDVVAEEQNATFTIHKKNLLQKKMKRNEMRKMKTSQKNKHFMFVSVRRLKKNNNLQMILVVK